MLRTSGLEVWRVPRPRVSRRKARGRRGSYSAAMRDRSWDGRITITSTTRIPSRFSGGTRRRTSFIRSMRATSWSTTSRNMASSSRPMTCAGGGYPGTEGRAASLRLRS